MKKSLMENFIFCAVLGQTMLGDRKTISVLLHVILPFADALQKRYS